MSPPQKKDRSPFPPCKKMLTFSFKSAMSACSLRLSALAFFCLSLASNAFAGEYTQILGDIKDEASSSAASLLNLESIFQNDFPLTVSGGNSASLRSESLKYYLWRTTRAVDQIRDQQTNDWLRLFLTGRSDGLANAVPRFRTLEGSDSYPPDSAYWTANGQSLQDFLSLTLGGFVKRGLGPVQQNFETAWRFENSYLPESGDSPIAAGYNFFTVWLAEAQRRLISNTTITNDDWRALNLSSNPVQVLRANLTRQEEMESTISNEVSATESQIEELFTVDQPSTPSGYDNADDFSDVADDLGSDDDSLSLQGTIRLASSSDIAGIVSSVGLHYTGPHAEISLSSHAGGVLASAVSSCNSVMSSVWQWIAALFIFRYVVYWYRKIREVLLQSSVTGSGVVQ